MRKHTKCTNVFCKTVSFHKGQTETQFKQLDNLPNEGVLSPIPKGESRDQNGSHKDETLNKNKDPNMMPMETKNPHENQEQQK